MRGHRLMVPGLIVIGAGAGIGVPATGTAVFASVPPHRAGMGSGTMATFRQLGQALGVAVLGVIFTGAVRGDLDGKVADAASAEGALTSGRRTSLGVLHDAGAHGLTAVYSASAALALVTALVTAAFIRNRAEAWSVGTESEGGTAIRDQSLETESGRSPLG